MSAENPAISSSWDVNRTHSDRLNTPPSGQESWPLLQVFLKLGGHSLFIRQMAIEKQTKLLEMIDRVCRLYVICTCLGLTTASSLAPILLGTGPRDQAAPTEYTRDAKPVVVLGEICSDTGLLPNSIGSLQGLKKLGEIAVASGGTTDTWRGVLDNKQVALKAFRIYTPQDLREAKKILWKSVPIWKRLNHENVLPFRGVDTAMFELALVYDWGHNGNIVQYLNSHSEASRPKLVTIPLCFIRIQCSKHPSSCCRSPEGFDTSILSKSFMET